MKKKLVTLFLLSVFVLAVTNAEVKKKLNKGGYYHEDGSYSFNTEKELTPKNSVLIYYTSGGLVENVTYAQINPKKEPMIFPIKSQGMAGVCVMPPAEPGSYFKVIEGTQKTANVDYYFMGGINLSYRIDIKVPEKPGIYFAGILSEAFPVSTYEEFLEYKKKEKGTTIFINLKSKEDFQKALDTQENACLKSMIKTYAGTAWEPFIKARMEELSK